MSLEDVIHAVPAFLDTCDADAHNILSLTNSTLRQAVHARVRSVSQQSLHFKELAALVAAPFFLTDLHISSTLSVSQVSVLIRGDWPMLQKLTLYIPLGTSASIQKITAAPWPQLEELDFGPTELEATHFKLLVKTEWPLKVLRCKLSQYMSANNLRDAMATLQQSSWSALQSIQLYNSHFNSVEAAAAGLSQLKKGDWQQLTKLSLGKWSLDKEAASHLVQARWPHLQSLTICVVSTDAIPLLTQADWPQLTQLQLTQCLAILRDQISPGLAMFQHSSWPMLKSLRLTGVKVTSNVLHAFSQADWTMLESFVSEWADGGWNAATISRLTEVKWPALKQLRLHGIGSLGQMLDAESITVAHWPVMESMYLATTPSHVADLMPLLNAPWPRLKVFKFRSDGLHPTGSEKFIQAAMKRWVGCFVGEGNPQF